ncbi:C39 family peptidase [Cytobacillus sp. FJAT-54145]|uniref:C39 family peptidase n=1 Tax=Cytobacillus spartinae TaxID=3299023 RepID=A0ABW6KGY4_9BACI
MKRKPLNKGKSLTKQSLGSKPKSTSKAINSQKESTKSKLPQKKEKVLLDVPLIKQNPELKYGCEVTSLTMVLQYAGVQTDKMDLFEGVKKDRDPLVKSNGDILKWGDPGDGFVGDMTGNNPGYAVFDKPITDLVNEFLPGRAINLTNRSFDEILNHVSSGYPVVVWTTGDYRLPDRWESWKHGNKVIKTPLDLHAVVLVGYDTDYVYLNDPLSGKKQVKVSKERFISSWEALKCRAVSYI